MALKKKSSGGGGANWMDTYGDMVTLLLCFFVLLYSMSTISEDKWKAIVQSFNPSAILDSQATAGDEGPVDDPSDGMGLSELALGPTEVDDILEALAQSLKEYAEENNMQEVIEITRGDGYVFVSFADVVFFSGDSAVIHSSGLELLDVVVEALEPAANYIDELRILGHTAQASANQPNRVSIDRKLASDRATNVLVYIQQNSEIDPARLVSIGYGQWRPVDTNEDNEHRAHNRRVEMLITGKDIESQLGDALEQYTSIRTGEASFRSDGEASSMSVSGIVGTTNGN